ncbi:MAG: 16S rRNA (adenine(1518)-N(6)/adenine(1519)-N(6))-dimethyltransferase RsmA [Candidatus Falkowbacteria bacterium]|nr:16S rRNA (adenine(1518)-N(6)/adenine(1519)-N(6))-dimethyltransferase RsmA [Candidatus Falkowbacteria bacterium]
MNLLNETINLSKLYGVKPTKNRGQNFLIDETVYEKIIDTAEIKSDETILEVGPGLGFLTMRIASSAKKVVAVELDKNLAEALTNRLELEEVKNVDVFNEDVMNLMAKWVKSFEKIDNKKIAVVANLPYTITSIFLRFFVGGNVANILPTRFILMLQKEVAERIIAKAGEMSLLALSVQLYSEPSIIHIVSRKSFWPAPAVDSAIILLRRNDQWLKMLKANGGTEKDLLRLMKIGFSARRKMLKANIANGYHVSAQAVALCLEKAKISPMARAQELDLKQWINLLPLIS